MEGLPPALATLAEMIGLLQASGDQYCLAADWFTNPLQKTADGFKGNGDQLAALLGQLLGEVSGQAIGVPIKDPALVGTWYPINMPGTADPTGLYVGSYPKGDDQVFGIAVYHNWPIPSSNPKLQVSAWAMAPLLSVGGGKLEPALTRPGYPITIGVAAQGLGSKPLIDTNGFSFGGVKFSAAIDVAASSLTGAVKLSIVVMQLQLPGETTAKDMSLADLEAISATEILNTASALFVSALSNLSQTAADRAKYLLPALGISTIVPGSKTQMPPLGWEQLLRIVIDGGDPATPFVNWFQKVAGTPDLLQLWLSCIAGFMGQPGTVTGDGSRTNPFMATLLDLSKTTPAIGVLSFSAATTVDTDRALRVFYPGLQFTAAPIQLGASKAALRIVANIELSQFTLSAGGVKFAGPSSLAFDVGLTLANLTPGQPLASMDGYQFGSLAAGLSLGVGVQPVPSFSLNSIVTPKGSYPSVNLLSPGELAQFAESQLIPMIEQQLFKLLGIDPKKGTAFVNNASAMLGILPPAVPQGSTWPTTLAPPFTLAQLPSTMQDPVRALGNYYLNVLTNSTPIAGQSPFYYMVSQLVGMLQDSGLSSVTITGSGTPASPWKATISLRDATLPGALTAYTQTISGVTQLVLGIHLGPTLNLAGTTIVPAIDLTFLTLNLPSAGTGFSGLWASDMGVSLSLPDGFTSGTVAGVSVQIGPASISAGWGRENGWNWSLLASNPTVTIAGTAIPLGQDLNFGNQTSLQSLVTNQVPAFVNMLAGMLGVALVRTNSRPGLALAGVLGLLKNFSQAPNFPAGLQWPSIPTLALTGFSDPRPALRAQIANDFASDQTGAAVLSLLAWAMNGSLTSAPEIAGTRSFANPFRVPIGAGFTMPVWYTDSGQAIGLGLGVLKSTNFATKYQIVTDVRLNAIEVSLATGQVQTGANTPSLSFLGTISNTTGPLIPGSAQAGILGQLQFGFTLSFASGSPVFTPVVNLIDATLPGEQPQALLTLADYQNPHFTDRLQQAFVLLLNQGLQLGIQQVAGEPSFQTAYSLLTSLGLAVPRVNAGDPYGINADGWQALLASPITFAEKQLSTLLTDPGLRATLFQYVQQQLGIQIPRIPTAVLDVLAALGFVGDAAHGYPLDLQALLNLAQHPFQTLSQSFQSLINDPSLLKTLASQLAGTIVPPDFGPFSFQSTGGNQISLSIKPANAVKLAGILELSGEIKLDLANNIVSADIDLFSPALQLGVVPALSYQVGSNTPQFTLKVQWGDGTRPSAPSLTIYPFQSQQFLDQLAQLAPAYVLSTIGAMVLESKVLSKYPLVQQIFTGLGIAQEQNGVWTMPSLLGVLYDPRGWLLSNGILGQNGTFDLGSFGALLSKIPAVSASNGLAIAPIAGGVKVSGLPYNFEIAFSTTSKLATIAVSTGNLSIASGNGKLQTLSFGVTVGPDAQPGVTGDIVLATSAALGTPFFVEAGYDKGFALTVGAGQVGSPSGISFQILPFLGWGSLLEQIARQVPALVLQELTPRLLTALSNAGAADFVNRLRTAGTDLQVGSLVTALGNLPTPLTIQAVEQVALTWLLARLAPANAAATAKAVATMLQGVLPKQISSEGGLVAFTPGTSLPITLLAGVNTVGGQSLAGVWVKLGLPQTSLLRASVLPTGIGVPLTGTPRPVFSFGIDLTIPIEGTVGPRISLEYDPSRGIELAFDPLGDSANSGTPSTLSRELLPQFFPPGTGQPANVGDRVEQWLVKVLEQVVPRYVTALVVNQPTVLHWLNSGIVSSSPTPTPGQILVASMLLQQSGGVYSLTPLSTLLNLDIKEFFGNFLRTLLQTQLQVLSFASGGGIWIGPDPNNASNYGLRVAAPGLKVPKLSNVVLQLGATDDLWITNSGGTTGNLKPGISAYVPISQSGGTFKPDFSNIQLNLVNVGMDIVGTGSAPLVNMSRFQLGSVQPRGLVQLSMNGGSPAVTFGAGVTLSDIAISLAPNTLVQGGGGNAVAKNLLGSGSNPNDKNPPANPKFSVAAAYTKTLWVNLSSGTAGGSQVIIPVQRTFGPIHANSIGLGWVQEQYLLQVLFDGSVALAGLRADLNQLTVGIPVTKLTDLSSYTIDLQGLNVTFNGGEVAISGGLLKTTDPLMYTGAALIKAANFSVMALGSYAVVPTTKDPNGPTAPSLFIFGALRAPLGGPPAFFVTGIAAGFGYNRNIRLPEVGAVQDFPLVSGVVNGTFSPGQKPDDALKVLNNWIAPEVGQYWLAAGLTFTSFQILDSFAALFLQFGREWSITLLGLTSAPLPKGLKPGLALAYIELGIKVAIKITEGIVSVEAQLTPNSYVIAKDCRLTGGFAFYLWFKDIKTEKYTISAGDFVVTLGGYHPAFQVPPYYPVVPRLGFSWLINAGVGTVTIGGGAYFAITPTAIMAGGYLQIVFTAGPLRAWLDASANFLVEWKPFYYSADISVSIGASLQATILGVKITLTVELGADLHLEGPPTHGQAHVSWFVISFTIPFGSQDNATGQNNLTWGQFADSFLPGAGDKQMAKRSRALQAGPARARLAALGESGGEQQIIKLNVQQGLLQSTDAGWLIRAVPFSLQAVSAIPTTNLSVAASNVTLTGPSTGVRPMALISLTSPVTITVSESGQPIDLKQRLVEVGGSYNGAPAALWSKDALDPEHAPNPATMLVKGALMGATLNAVTYIRFGSYGPFPLVNLKYTPGNPIQLPFARTPAISPAARFTQQQQETAFAILQGSIMAPAPISARNALFTALQASAIAAELNPDLSVMATSASLVLQQRPVLARPTIYQGGATGQGKALEARGTRAVPSVTAQPREPELIGAIRRYHTGESIAPSAHAGLPRHAASISGRWVDARRTVDPRALRSFSQPGAAESTVYAGSLSLWKTDANTAHELSTQGAIPVRFLSFDEHGEILADRTAKPGERHSLPAGTGMAGLYGAEPPRSTVLAGWQVDSTLIRVNLYYAVGENCTVRTQNLFRERRKGRPVTRGIVTALDMTAGNLVEDVGGVNIPGWIETIFPVTGQSFVVAVETARGVKPDVRVTAAPGDRPGLTSQVELTPDAAFSNGGATMLVFASPVGQHEYLSVVTQPRDESSSILGVYLLDVPPQQAAENWPSIRLAQCALRPRDAAPPSTRTVLSTGSGGKQ